MPPETEFGIVEMGASAQGEIAQLASIAEPDYGLLTNIGRAHLGGFGGPEGCGAARANCSTIWPHTAAAPSSSRTTKRSTRWPPNANRWPWSTIRHRWPTASRPIWRVTTTASTWQQPWPWTLVRGLRSEDPPRRGRLRAGQPPLATHRNPSQYGHRRLLQRQPGQHARRHRESPCGGARRTQTPRVDSGRHARAGRMVALRTRHHHPGRRPGTPRPN